MNPLRTLLLVCFLLCLNLIHAQVKVVAHRGASKFAPENTLPSCQKAIELGADYIEMDVRQTKDGVFILMHDATLDRTTNGTGKVKEVTYEYIQTLDAGSHFGEEFRGTKVPTLREALQAIQGRCLPDIDFKAGDPEALVKVLEEEGFLANGDITLYSGNYDKLKAITRLTDQIMIRPACKGKRKGLESLKAELDPPIVNINYRNFSPRYVKAIHGQDMKAFVNTLFWPHDKKRKMIRAIEAGADFIQSDHLEILVPLLRERGLHD